MQMTAEQFRLMLYVEEKCIQCYAHQPELGFDVMPTTEGLTKLAIDWYMAGRTVYHD